MKKQITKYSILLLLAALFAAPSITAYIFFQHPAWLSASKVNKGTLLNPPVALSSFNKDSKWRIIFWNPGVCDRLCLQQLDVLARVRLALGRKLYQVDQWLLLGDTRITLNESLQSQLKNSDFHVPQLSREELATLTALSPDAKIYIANPDNYLVLSYKAQVNPEDVYKDLKLLLNTTEHKNG